MKLYKKLSDAIKNQSQVFALKLKIDDGDLPTELFDLPKLQELHLEGNIRELPEEFLTLRQLTTLSLKSSREIDSLVYALRLPALINLKVIDTELSRLEIPLGTVNDSLQSLTLKNALLEELPDEISQLQSLTEINLSGNRLHSLPKGFYELKKLRRLNLDSNKFQFFPDRLSSLPGLNHLSLDQNPFSDEERARIQKKFHLHL